MSHARVTSDPINLTKQLAGSLQTGATRPNQVVTETSLDVINYDELLG